MDFDLDRANDNTDKPIGPLDAFHPPSKQEDYKTRATYIGSSKHDCSDVSTFLANLRARQTADPSKSAVCIIENITASWVRAIRDALNIPQAFFDAHAQNPPNESLWDSVFLRSENPTWEPEVKPPTQWESIDAIYEYHGWKYLYETKVGSDKAIIPATGDNFIKRTWWEGPSPYPLSSNTKLSYCSLGNIPNVIIFLVDRPLELNSGPFARTSNERTTLRLPHSCNRGGLMLPQLFAESDYNLYNSLSNCLQHRWHWNILFAPHLKSSINASPENRWVLGASELLYMLSASLWETNRRYLEGEIRRISFKEIRQPTIKTNSTLHDLREDLVSLQDGVAEAERYVPESVKQYYTEHYDSGRLRQLMNQASPVERHASILRDADKLSNFLMQTFDILNSTIGVLDSQTSLEQARRSARLTNLAFIYVPLSFVTGIYGMNIKEINGSPLSVWVTVVTLAVIGVGTAAIFLSYGKYVQHKQAKKQLRPQMRESLKSRLITKLTKREMHKTSSKSKSKRRDSSTFDSESKSPTSKAVEYESNPARMKWTAIKLRLKLWMIRVPFIPVERKQLWVEAYYTFKVDPYCYLAEVERQKLMTLPSSLPWWKRARNRWIEWRLPYEERDTF